MVFYVLIHYLCIKPIKIVNAMRHTRKFNEEWTEAIALLPEGTKESLTAAIVLYQHMGIEPENLDPIARALFIVIKPTIDARKHRAEYQRARRKRLKGIKNSAPAIKPKTAKSIPTPAKTKTQTKVEAKTTVKTQKKAEVKTSAPTEISAPPKPQAAAVQPAPVKGSAFLRDVNKARTLHAANRKHHPHYAKR